MEKLNRIPNLHDGRSLLPRRTRSSTRSAASAQPRSSSLEGAGSKNRRENAAYLSLMPPTSNSRGGGGYMMQSTPRATPKSSGYRTPKPMTGSKPTPARNTLFQKNVSNQQEERYRKPFFIGAAAIGSGVAGSGHCSANDKHTVQERIARITEYLIWKSAGGNIDGLGMDFQNRGLKHMTFGHFLAIVNHFLRYIVGERFTVGENYVEDICNLLPKLHYPYPINKSWLKTPNTQQAFVNVIAVLDFLMEFTPPLMMMGEIEERDQDEDEDRDQNEDQNKENATENPKNIEFCYFDLELPEKTTIPDVKFQRQLLNDAVQAFPIWKSTSQKDYLRKEKQSIDRFVRRVVGSAQVRNIDDLQQESRRLQQQLQEIHENLGKYDDTELQANVLQLTGEIKSVHDELNDLKEEKERISVIIDKYEWEEMNIKSNCQKLRKHLKEHNNDYNVEEEEKNGKRELDEKGQPVPTIEYRNKLISLVTLIKHNLGIEERTLDDVRNRSDETHTESLELSIEMADLIGRFNVQIRDVIYSKLLMKETTQQMDALVDVGLFQLPLNLMERKPIDAMRMKLSQLNEEILRRLEHVDKKVVEMHDRNFYLETVKIHRLQLKLNSLQMLDKHELTKLQQYRDGYEKLLQELQEQRGNLMASVKRLDCDIIQMKIDINERYQILQKLEANNDLKVQELEERHRIRYVEKTQFLHEYKKLLQENQMNMEQLRKCVNDDRNLVLRLKDKLQQLKASKGDNGARGVAAQTGASIA